MSLERVQKLFAYLTVGLALLALAMSGAVRSVVWFGLPLALIVSWFWDVSPRVAARQRRFWNVVLVALIGLTAYEIFAGRAPVLQPAVNLVLVLVVTKLFQRSSARDYQQLYALSFLVIAVATVLDDDVQFGLFFLVYLVAFGVGFSLCHLVQQAETHRVSLVEELRIDRRQLGLLGLTSTLLVLLATAFFLILPRVGIGLGAGSPNAPSRLTGFSDTIDLSDHGLIGLDDRVVLRADVDGPVRQPYWRGMAFDHFDGKRWKVSPPLRRRHGIPADADGRFLLSDRTPNVRQHIEMEPLTTDVLFGLSHVVSVGYPEGSGVPRDSWHNLSIDATGALHHAFGGGQRIEVIVESDVSGAPRPDGHATTPEWIHQFYLSLPTGLSARVHRLARQVTDDAPSATEKARAIEQYLTTNYMYTLDLPRRGDHPVEDFLFERPQGHCEFFSTSMVILLRSIGIAARNVNGFQGGDWNPVGRYYIVRRLHAHSWVEAWIPGAGWVTFDPTPAAGRLATRDEAETGWQAAFDGYLDQLQRLWRSWVVNYDLGRQLEFFGAKGAGHADFSSAVRGVWRSLSRRWVGWLSILLCLALIALLLRRTRRILPVVLLGTAATVGIAWLTWGGVPAWPALLAAALVPSYLAWKLRLLSTGRRPVKGRGPGLTRLYLRIECAVSRLPGFEDASAHGPEQLAIRLRAFDDPRLLDLADLLTRYGRLRFGRSQPTMTQVKVLRQEWGAAAPVEVDAFSDAGGEGSGALGLGGDIE